MATYPSWFAMIGLLCCVFPAAAQRAVVLVRHAELQGQVMAQPAHTPLSDVGQLRAQRLADLLQPSGVTAVYATEFVRTRDTAAPLAERQGLPVIVVAKAEPAALVERIRKEHPDGTVLVVAHSDTLPTLVAAFGRSAEEGRVAATDYGQVFVLTPQLSGPATLVRMKY